MSHVAIQPVQARSTWKALRKEKGQTFVEFVILLPVLLIMSIAFIELYRIASLHHRLISSTREGGRIIVAEEITPSVSSTYSENYNSMLLVIEQDVYTRIKNMTSPSNIDQRGKVIISYLRRYDGHDRDSSLPRTDYGDPSTEVDDTIEVEYQFIYPSGAYPTWTSHFGLPSTAVPDSVLSLQSLRIDERTVAVEIFHETSIMPPVQRLMNAFDKVYLYDMAIF